MRAEKQGCDRFRPLNPGTGWLRVSLDKHSSSTLPTTQQRTRRNLLMQAASAFVMKGSYGQKSGAAQAAPAAPLLPTALSYKAIYYFIRLCWCPMPIFLTVDFPPTLLLYLATSDSNGYYAKFVFISSLSCRRFQR